MIIEENEFELIEAEMDYANYMAQKEFLDELAVISLSVRESTYLTEAENNSIKNAVMRFIHKVVANLQTAWNKFKRKITESVWNKIKTKYEKELTMNRDLQVVKSSDSDLFVDWEKLYQFLGTDIKILITKDMGDADELAIIKQIPYFANINKFSKQDMQQIVAGNCFSKIQDGNTIDLKRVTEYRAYLDKIDQIIAPIENDIATFNQLEKQIETMVNNGTNVRVNMPARPNPTVNNTQEAFELVVDTASRYLTEFTAEDKNDPKGEETVKGGSNDLQKKATKLIKVATSILSVEMWATNKAVSKSLTIVLAYVRNAAKYNPDRKKDNKTNNENK